MNGIIDFSSLIFLVLAVVIFLRLRSVLGRRTGSERPPFDPYVRRDESAANGDDTVIGLPQRAPSPDLREPEMADDAAERVTSAVKENSPAFEALKAIAAADRDFDAKQFIGGAKAAYEEIVTAFAHGDRRKLRRLLSREVLDGFTGAIDDREQRGETIEFKFVGIDQTDITGADMKDRTAQVTIRFLSKLISATRDHSGDVVDGDPVHVSDVTDIWTFARDVSSGDPNWRLVATESVD